MKLEAAETAAVVIDVQVDFCSPQGVLARERGRDLSMIEPMIDRLERAVAAAERTGVAVFYFRQLYDRTHLTNRQWVQYDEGRLVTCRAGEQGAEFYRIKPPAERVFTKYDFNIFSCRPFVAELERRRVQNVVVMGVDTQYCVETAVRHGFDLGYRMVVPRDLVATNGRYRDMHDRTLALVERTFGRVVTAAELGWR